MSTVLWVLMCVAPPAAALVAIWLGLAPPDDEPVDWLETHPKYAGEVDDVEPAWWPVVVDITGEPAGRHARPVRGAA